MADDRSDARQAAARMHKRSMADLSSAEQAAAKGEALRAQEDARNAPASARAELDARSQRASDRLQQVRSQDEQRIERQSRGD